MRRAGERRSTVDPNPSAVIDPAAICTVALTKQSSVAKCVLGKSYGCSGTVANKTMCATQAGQPFSHLAFHRQSPVAASQPLAEVDYCAQVDHQWLPRCLHVRRRD